MTTYSKLSDLVGTSDAVITTIFREKGSAWSSGWHNGVDIAASQGTPIKAAADGNVIASGWNSGGFGNHVVLKHADGKATLYGHMVSTPSVKVGQTVKKGQVIGKVGNTGLSYGAHLHFTIIDNYDKNPNIYYAGDLLDPIKVCGLGLLKISGSRTIVENGVTKNISDLKNYYGESTVVISNANSTAATSTAKKSVDELAEEVIRGKWGVGQERKNKLTAAGHSYDDVQRRVNEILSGKTTTKTPLKSLDEVVAEVIRGEWGAGAERKMRLTNAGYDYIKIQSRVNQLIK